jgi:hypothetical protein
VPNLEQPAVAEDSQTNTGDEAAAAVPPSEGATTQSKARSADQDPGARRARDDGDARDDELPQGTDGRQREQQSTSARKRATPNQSWRRPDWRSQRRLASSTTAPSKRARTIAP